MLYGIPIFSSMIEIFRPFGVPHVYSSIMMSPWARFFALA